VADSEELLDKDTIQVFEELRLGLSEALLEEKGRDEEDRSS
jgi:hypothetical protein